MTEDPNGECLKEEEERSAHPNGEHLKKQEILADSKAEANKTPVEVAEVIVEASAPNGKGDSS